MNRSLASAAEATAAFSAAPFSPLARRLCGLAAGFDDARQLALFFCVEQGNLADIVQVQSD